MLPDKVKLKEFIITKTLLSEMLKGLRYLRNRRSKTMKIIMATNSQLSTTEFKNNKLKKQAE